MGECPELEGRIARKGKTMNQDKARHHMIFGSLILFVLFGGLTLYVVSIVEASPGPDSAASNATFRAKCAMCHGQEDRKSTRLNSSHTVISYAVFCLKKKKNNQNKTNNR